ncbi:MAG: adenine phosphoribosyltransferase [Epsilonproteobacteria bacterium]|nr:adenine phosphoribosyltransferase [Campylobacterota bacterium]
MANLTEQERAKLLDSIRDVKDFPKEGIVFKDITTLLNNPEALDILMSHLESRYRGYNLDFIVGIDARGFIFGSILADRLKVGFVPARKRGKLPYRTISESYSLEYGSDEVEIHLDAFRGIDGAKVLVIDDLIATGGTAGAVVNLVKRAGGVAVESCFIVELKFLSGRERVASPIYSVLSY